MDIATITAAGGMRSRMDSLSLVANNLANAGSAGFKADEPYFGSFATALAGSPFGLMTQMPETQKQWTDFSQGPRVSTGNTLDFSISGPGFFVLKQQDGELLYSRNGNFRLSASGEMISSTGAQVMGRAGVPLRVAPDRPFEISRDGVLHQDGQILGQIDLVEFPDPKVLAKAAGGAFRNPGSASVGTRVLNPALEQGTLEMSNVTVPQSVVRLIDTMRQFEMLQRALNIAGQMNSKGVEEVARLAG